MAKNQSGHGAGETPGKGSPLPNDVSTAFKGAESFYYANLQSLNGSGVEGEVLLAFDEDTRQLTVVVTADGLEANQVHIQHIHGFQTDQDARIPGPGADADGDGYIEVAEGVPDYGGILLDVKLDHADGAGTDNGHSHSEGFSGFPTAPTGSIRFVETYTLPKQALDADDDFDMYHFVIHGMSVPDGAGAGTSMEVDGTAGYKLALPVAIGEFTEISRGRALGELGEARGEFAQDRAYALQMSSGHHSSAGSDWLFN